MPPSRADAPITTSAHFIQKQIVNVILDEQPGDSTAPTGADKLLKPEGGITEERIFQNKNMQPLVYGRTDHRPHGHASLQTAY